MRIGEDRMKAVRGLYAALDAEVQPMLPHWADLADAYLPRRYTPLAQRGTTVKVASRNKNILNSTGTQAARVLASGMMNGITSPSRKWFRLRLAGQVGRESRAVKAWFAEVERILMFIMARSNFYKSLAVLYLDLGVFGTGAMLIYEDPDTVIHTYNPPLGEFKIGQDHRQRVNQFSRELVMQVRQVVSMFGLENCGDAVKTAWERGGGSHLQKVVVRHLIEPNSPRVQSMSKSFAFREYYWEAGQRTDLCLAARGFHEFPAACPRWELSGNFVYGGSPGMDALGDVLQLQQETLVKAKGLEKGVDPPLLADAALQHQAVSANPSGITYVPGLMNGQPGARPLSTVNMPLGELTLDIREVEGRIRETFHNDLFRMIASLDTVRSATEIDARREEKLVLLGPVLERFENEALDPIIARIFAIADRAGLLPPPPAELEGAPLDIEYTSLLATAQQATDTIATERFFQLVGNLAPLYPEVRHVPEVTRLLSRYADSIGVPADGVRDEAEVQKAVQAEQEAAQAQQAMQEAGQVAEGAKTLSQTEVGGGMNALEAMMGGGGDG